MAKFKVGDEVAIAALVKITAIQPTVMGKVSYSTDRGFCIHETLMDEIALAPKEPKAEEPKPAPKKLFKIGDRVVTSMGHGTVNQVDANSETMPYLINYDNGGLLWSNSAGAKPEPSPQPAPQPAHRFKVGDRVETDIGIGVIVEDDKSSVPYRIYYEKHPTHGSFSGWATERDLSPAPAPEPPKFYTGKVVCISGEYGVGRIFTVKDGFFVDNIYNCPGKPYKSVDDMNDRFLFGNFAEAKE